MIDHLLQEIAKRYPLTEQPADEYASLKANGMRFTIRSYEAKGLGHVSTMQAKGFFGLMRMDTLILNPLEKDLPLYSYDRVHAMGNDTLIVELYDTLLEPRAFEAVRKVQKSFSDLPDHPLGEHWYDPIKLPESISKKGKTDAGARFDALTEEHLSALLNAAPEDACDPAAKREKSAVYVEGLLTHGGPSTDVFKRALGDESTAKLFRTVLFGTVG